MSNSDILVKATNSIRSIIENETTLNSNIVTLTNSEIEKIKVHLEKIDQFAHDLKEEVEIARRCR